MKKTLLTTTAALLIGAGALSAQTVAEQVIAALQAQGYESIEVKNGPTQVKVEAIRDGRKLEVIYDAVTGEILKQEVSNVLAGDESSEPLKVTNEDEDFLDDESDDEEDDDEEDDDDDGDDDEEDDDSDEDDDDEEDDDSDEDDDDEEDDDSDEDDDDEEDDQ